MVILYINIVYVFLVFPNVTWGKSCLMILSQIILIKSIYLCDIIKALLPSNMTCCSVTITVDTIYYFRAKCVVANLSLSLFTAIINLLDTHSQLCFTWSIHSHAFGNRRQINLKSHFSKLQNYYYYCQTYLIHYEKK